ncbi:MAG: type I-F CRISPR-associated helicase Cas3f [Methylococcales bacterium]
MVTFVSQCEHKALNRTRRVLDAFANRIGSRTWQTVITEEGLQAVKKLLRHTATKNTAVSCHWIRSRSRSELAWIVGNRAKFNQQGIVPVNWTQKNLLNSQWENDWHILPLIKSLTALAALFHDWGKASELFQDKLNPKSENTYKGDPLRHEWISTLFFNAYVNGETDEQWLTRLTAGEFDLENLKRLAKENTNKPLSELPKAASFIAWLIVSHHRLPVPKDIDINHPITGKNPITFEDIFFQITSDFGYKNGEQETNYSQLLQQCFSYPFGLPSDSSLWVNKIKKEASNLFNELKKLDIAIENGSWRLIFQLSRLSLMLGDHYYSSCPADTKWKSRDNDKLISKLYANTDKDSKTKKIILKQRLDEHLVEVAKNALNSARLLPDFENSLLPLYDAKSLKFRTTDDDYKWQDKAVTNINKWKNKLPENQKDSRQGFFAVNMASTGCGKTFANPKIMQALSNDGKSMRYVLALGLRTLTLQTGNEYRNKINPEDQTDIAVLIGSKAVMELHEQNTKSQQQIEAQENENQGSESLEELIENDTDYGISAKELLESPLAKIFPEKTALKNMRFIHPAILVCTIDYMMAATETKRGGKNLLPTLRLMSSDLVIDEIDDFDGLDQVAIGRLIHLAGMLGRKVMISSATITPNLAEGYFNTYREGWKIFSSARNCSYSVGCAWVDEFSTVVESINELNTEQALNNYQNQHAKFINKRVENIKKKEQEKGVKRKGEIIQCKELHPSQAEDVEDKQTLYFEKIKQTLLSKHLQHHTLDQKTNKKVSFGVVRIANIEPCIALYEYFINSEWDNQFDVKIMVYHSRQILLLRHEQEKHLDAVLTRKEKIGERPKAFDVIKHHLERSAAENVVFILVATPVEEVGRDHDFDWAVIEPSSFRSIIQLSGRVLRHRNKVPTEPNVALMQYNLNSINRGDNIPAYHHPGYEGKGIVKLNYHDLTQLLDEPLILESINAIPRIQPAKLLKPKEKLADLEHFAISKYLTNYENHRPDAMQGWLDRCWWLTAIPQALVKFRNSQPTTQLFLVPDIDNSEIFDFKERTPKGKLTLSSYSIEQDKQEVSERLWLKRDYASSLAAIAEEKNISEFIAALRYGEITVDTGQQKYSYSDQYGLKKVKE